jgi:hypothetical protein
MQVTTVGLDLAKNIFQVHGVTDCGEVAFNRALRRSQVLAFFERLEPCLIGMEACSTSHYWARELLKPGHDVKLIPPVYVKPYVKRGKSDAADAEAICEAVTRPTMRFVEVKTPDQQAILALHRTRDLVVRQRTQTINMLRGQLAEFGIVFPQGVGHATRFARLMLGGEVPTCLPDLPARFAGRRGWRDRRPLRTAHVFAWKDCGIHSGYDQSGPTRRAGCASADHPGDRTDHGLRHCGNCWDRSAIWEWTRLRGLARTDAAE